MQTPVSKVPPLTTTTEYQSEKWPDQKDAVEQWKGNKYFESTTTESGLLHLEPWPAISEPVTPARPASGKQSMVGAPARALADIASWSSLSWKPVHVVKRGD